MIKSLIPTLAVMMALLCGGAHGAQPAECGSPNPNDWPPAARPYFMIIADTSGSMTACTNPATAYPQTCAFDAVPNACGLTPTRYNDLRCALEKMTQAYSGLARFGLATYAVLLEFCPQSCSSTCSAGASDCVQETFGCNAMCTQAEVNDTGSCAGCGPGIGPTRAGALIRVPIAPDSGGMPNGQDLLGWVDRSCAGDAELFAAGSTPMNGALRDMKRYLESGWTHPDGLVTYASPLGPDDPPCRSINVILITDGEETCDTQSSVEDAAAELFDVGVTVGDNTFPVRTHVINFAGGNQANASAIASAGGTGSALFATNEVELAQALSDIIVSSARNEVCDNQDNDCNGCIDEGFRHFANTGQACCDWTNLAERGQCLSNHAASIATLPPDGDLSLLPCTNPSQQDDPDLWLCVNPGEVCDSIDNNGLFGADEGVLRCGDPPHCPETEVCNGLDDDCDGLIDEDNVCGGCLPTPEICDGCDNDCDGIVDNGSFPDRACGLAEPAQCGEVKSCAPPQAVAVGSCVAGAGYGSCTLLPQPETCDGIDNDCNGAIDDGLSPVACVPPGTPPDLVFGGSSQCRQGQQFCGQSCSGFIGPTADVTDGIDNDCDGLIDNTPEFLMEDVFANGFESVGGTRTLSGTSAAD